MTQTPPPEPPGGQDDGPPDLHRALLVVLLLLADVDDYLRLTAGDRARLRERIGAVSAVLHRIIEGMDDGRLDT